MFPLVAGKRTVISAGEEESIEHNGEEVALEVELQQIAAKHIAPTTLAITNCAECGQRGRKGQPCVWCGHGVHGCPWRVMSLPPGVPSWEWVPM